MVDIRMRRQRNFKYADQAKGFWGATGKRLRKTAQDLVCKIREGGMGHVLGEECPANAHRLSL